MNNQQIAIIAAAILNNKRNGFIGEVTKDTIYSAKMFLTWLVELENIEQENDLE